MSEYGPSIKVARLYEKISSRGNLYLVGRMGGVRVTILKSNEGSEDAPIWNLLFSEAPAKSETVRQPPNRAANGVKALESELPLDGSNAPAKTATVAANGVKPSVSDDQIPF